MRAGTIATFSFFAYEYVRREYCMSRGQNRADEVSAYIEREVEV